MATVTMERWRSRPYHSCGAQVSTKPYEVIEVDADAWPLRFWCNYCAKYVHRRECYQSAMLCWKVS